MLAIEPGINDPVAYGAGARILSNFSISASEISLSLHMPGPSIVETIYEALHRPEMDGRFD